MRYAKHDPTLADWVDYFEPELERLSSVQDRERFLREQIDKMRGRGVMSEAMVFALQMYFRLDDWRGGQ
jgi:hypothetical protein